MIFITGGTGLVGSHLLFELVSKGNKIRALKRETGNIDKVKHVFSYYSEEPDALLSKIEWVTGDIFDYDSIEENIDEVDEIYHIAALVSYDPKENELVKKNILGTQNMINVALEKGVNKFCYVSSIASLGEPLNGDKIDENCNWNPKVKKTAYAYSKHYSEMEVWRGAAEGLNVVIVNPSIILGSGFWNTGSSTFFSTIYKGLNFYPQGINGFIDVRDLVKIMVELMEKKIFNERFIINSENYSYKELLHLIAKGLNVKVPNIKATDFMLAVSWRFAKLFSIITGNSTILTKESVKYANSESFYSNEKIVQVLDYHFKTVEESVRENCKLFLEDVIRSC